MSERLNAVIAAIDAANDADPTRVTIDGKECGAAMLYGERMTVWLERLAPDAGELLQLAVRAQHLERFKLPRSEYPMDKPGYFRWRNEQRRRQSVRLTELMLSAGYSEEEAARSAAIVRKENLQKDAEVQLLEDCACLVFLQYESADFVAKHEEEKVIDILRKTWGKMSEQGHEEALKLDMPPELLSLVKKALA